VLRDVATTMTSRILVDTRETFEKLETFAGDYTLNFRDRIHHYSGERPLFDLYGIEDEIGRALGRACRSSRAVTSSSIRPRLHPPSTSTPAASSAAQLRRHHLSDQLEAAHVIARQCDCVTSAASSSSTSSTWKRVHRDAVLTEFRKALSLDRTRITVQRFHLARLDRNDA
jgi:ribonuclease G